MAELSRTRLVFDATTRTSDGARLRALRTREVQVVAVSDPPVNAERGVVWIEGSRDGGGTWIPLGGALWDQTCRFVDKRQTVNPRVLLAVGGGELPPMIRVAVEPLDGGRSTVTADLVETDTSVLERF